MPSIRSGGRFIARAMAHGEVHDPALVAGRVKVPHLDGQGHRLDRALEGHLELAQGVLELVLGPTGVEDPALELGVGPGQLVGAQADLVFELLLDEAQVPLRPPAVGDLFLEVLGALLDLLLERPVEVLELAVGDLEAVDHRVEGPGQLPDLVVRADRGPLLEVAAGDALGRSGHGRERLGDERAQAKDKEDAAGEDDEADEGDGILVAAQFPEGLGQGEAQEQPSEAPVAGEERSGRPEEHARTERRGLPVHPLEIPGLGLGAVVGGHDLPRVVEDDEVGELVLLPDTPEEVFEVLSVARGEGEVQRVGRHVHEARVSLGQGL